VSEHPRKHSLWGASPAPDHGDDEPQGPVADDRSDPRNRPRDPAGTQPKFDPRELLPTSREPLLRRHAAGVVESDVAEDDDGDLLPERRDAAGAAGAGAGQSYSAHAPRFQFAIGALIACALAGLAVAAAIVISGNARSSGPEALAGWSDWKPTAAAGSGATQIADHVGREYRLPDGKQLVAVTGGPMEIASLPLTVALRNQVGDINLVGGKGVLFRLCGLGAQCAIPTGKASQERHLLLRREALELALYSFRYLDVDYAVVFLPPKKGEDPSQAIYLPKRNVQSAMDRPLAATLYHRTPNTATVTASPDAPFVQQLTTRQLFTIKGFTQGNQDARAYLVLEPLGG
jgi:hypothetical protein